MTRAHAATAAPRKRWTRVVAVAGTARRLDGVEVDLPSRLRRRTHTHTVAAVARAAAARTQHTTHAVAAAQASKTTYHAQVRGRLLS